MVFSSKESMMASCSNLSSERPTAKSSDSRKRLPEEITELLDVAIFTFSCQSGLRSVHKIRGDPVLEGVSAFFGHLIRTANVELQAKLEELSPSRLGGWQPGQEATSQRLTLVSSRIIKGSCEQLMDECYLVPLFQNEFSVVETYDMEMSLIWSNVVHRF